MVGRANKVVKFQVSNWKSRFLGFANQYTIHDSNKQQQINNKWAGRPWTDTGKWQVNTTVNLSITQALIGVHIFGLLRHCWRDYTLLEESFLPFHFFYRLAKRLLQHQKDYCCGCVLCVWKTCHNYYRKIAACDRLLATLKFLVHALHFL